MDIEVSVVIPTYNSSEYIAQAIESVLNQTYNNLEIIIVNDASTDTTLEIINNFEDRRINVITNRFNLGVSASRNLAIKRAKGNWIALLDSDDWYAPERLEKLLKVARQTKADMIADNLYLMRDREKCPWSTLLDENKDDWQSFQAIDALTLIKTDKPSTINSPRNWSFGYIKPLIKHSFLKEHELEYDETIKVGEDFTLYLKCFIYQAKFFLLSQPYYYYRIRNSSLSNRKPTEYLYQSYKLTKKIVETEDFIQKNQTLLSAMSENLNVFEKQLSYHYVVEFGKQGKAIGVITEIVKHPQVLSDVLARLTFIVKNRTMKFIFHKIMAIEAYLITLQNKRDKK